MYKEVVENGKGARGRTAQAVYLSCIFIACRQLGVPRTFKELQAAVPGVDNKDVSRSYKAIVKMFQEQAIASGADLLSTSANTFTGDRLQYLYNQQGWMLPILLKGCYIGSSRQK